METKNEYLFERGGSPLRFESACDYVLPDYNTDVKRVLFAKARVTDSGCYIDGDSVNLNGAIEYEVVYLDSEGELTSSKFSTDFDSSQRCNGEAVVGVFADTRIVGFSLRPVGPRKFSAKAQLTSAVNITERAEIEVLGGALLLGDAELKTETASIAYRCFSTPIERSYNATVLSLDGVIADDVVVLYSGVTPDVTATVTDCSVALAGMLRLVVLLEREGEVPTAINYEFEIDEVVPMDDLPENAVASAYGRVGAIRIETLPTENGVDLSASFDVEYTVCAVGNKSYSVILDGYLTDRDVENTYEQFSYTRHVGSFGVSDEISLSPTFAELGCDKLREILLSDATVRVDEITPTGSEAKIKGVLRFSGVACQINDDGTLGYTGIKTDIPFLTNVNNCCHMLHESRICFHGDVVNLSAVSTAEGVDISARISGTMEVMLPVTLTRLSLSEACADKIESDGSVITVYYPTEGETLFDVGRKFHTRTLEIAANNSLTEDVFSSCGESLLSLGVSSLLIM